MATAQEIITDAYIDVGAIDALEPLTADEAAFGLRRLNDLLDSLSNERLHVFQIKQELFPLSAGVSSYTIGPAATWNTIRPLRIDSAFVRVGSVDYPLLVETRSGFSAIYEKTITGIPEQMIYDGGMPIGTITLWPVPDGAYTIALNSHAQLATFATLLTEVSLPSGYLRLLKTSLAVELALTPAFNVGSVDGLMERAKKARSAVQRMNSQIRPLSMPDDLMCAGRYPRGEF